MFHKKNFVDEYTKLFKRNGEKSLENYSLRV